MSERVPLLVNRSSGSAPADPVAFAAELDARLVVEAAEASALPALAARLARRGAATVAVAGGDGTMRGAAESLHGSATALLPVPTGTLNHFARRVGVDDHDAVRTALREGSVAEVPVGRFGERLFLNTLTFGEYAHVVRVRSRLSRYLTKWPAAAVGFLAALARGRVLELVFDVEGQRVQRRSAFVWIGVGRDSFPRVHEAGDAPPAGSALEVAVLRANSAPGAAAFLVRLGARLLRRELPVRDPALEVFHTRRLTLHARHRIDATADGEIFRLHPPVEIELVEGGLRVLRPRPQADGATT